MNITSVIVGMTLAGVAAPQVANMSIQPFIAQKRAANFGIAETAAVSFSAANEGQAALQQTPGGCTVDPLPSNAYTVTCIAGEGKYEQSVTRSFRLAPTATGGTDSRFQYPAPPGFTGIECHTWEQWGINSSAFDQATNTWVGKSCNPSETRARAWYNNSNPDNWIYNIDNYNGWGSRLND
jgi:hypothetical protein